MTPTTSNRTPRAVTLKAGERFIVPPGATIDSIITTGNGVAISECDLPTPSAYKCGVLKFYMDAGEETNHSMDEKETRLVELRVGTQVFPMEAQKVIEGDSPGNPVNIGILNSFITNPALFIFTERVAFESAGPKQIVNFFFKTPEALFNTVELKLSNWDSSIYVKGEPAECRGA